MVCESVSNLRPASYADTNCKNVAKASFVFLLAAVITTAAIVTLYNAQGRPPLSFNAEFLRQGAEKLGVVGSAVLVGAGGIGAGASLIWGLTHLRVEPPKGNKDPL